jgi:beta-glucosidase
MLVLIILKTLFAVRRCDTPSDRAEILLKKMNLEEKLRMMRGSLAGDYVGNIEGNERLGIPAIAMQDGPQGFRITKKTGEEGTSTAWPSSLNIAATFNPELAFRWATAMAVEFVSKGANMQLAPGLGIARVPTAGRNFEYLCGEDPELGSLLAYQVVKGIQSQGIIANAKHFINNEIETNRMEVSATVTEKVRFQLYYPPFQAAIDAGVLSVMCSYNRVNGVSACENEVTMSELRGPLGYTGWILSDWLATHSTVNSVRAGLDQELPVGLYLSESALRLALNFSALQIEDIDRSVRRILTSMYAAGLFDEVYVRGDPLADVTSPEHSALAREVAAKSIVLLKNDKNLLPLNKSMLQKIGVFGDETTVSGGGSGHVTPGHGHTVTPAEGIAAALIGYDVFVEYFELPKGVSKQKALELAAQFAATCDVTVVVVATTSTEGYDRPSLQLGNGQDELVSAVAAANPHTVVAVNTPGAVLMPWAADVSTLLVCWMPGEQAGNALADILFGIVNPSARLPVTMPNEENEIGFAKKQFPGVGRPPVAEYSEGLLVGYR